MPRFFLPDVPLHLIQRGNDRRDLFHDADDFAFYLRCLGVAARRDGTAVHGYVLMTNHVHLVVTPRDAASVPKTMQSVGRLYVAHFNRKHGHTGTRFEGRYKAAVVQDEAYLLNCLRYVELNPMRAGMVAHPCEYRWSSYRANAMGHADSVVTAHPLQVALGKDKHERQAAYQALFGTPLLPALIEALRDATQYNWAIGDASFRQRVSAASRRAERLPAGRRPLPESPLSASPHPGPVATK